MTYWTDQRRLATLSAERERERLAASEKSFKEKLRTALNEILSEEFEECSSQSSLKENLLLLLGGSGEP